MLTREQAKAITDEVLSLSTADKTEVTVNGGETTHLRFARNTPSTSGVYSEIAVQVSCSFGRRSGAVTVNQLDHAGLASAVERASALARLAPEDAENMPLLPPQAYPQVDAFFADTAERGAAAMADGVATCLSEARAAGLVAAGFTKAQSRFTCVASSSGLIGYHRYTHADAAETARTPPGSGAGSGWAAAASRCIGDIDYGRISRVAMAKAIASASPRPLDPGSYVTILEPSCVANLIGQLAGDMDRRRADEGRSALSAASGGSRLGEKLFGDRVSLYTDPQDQTVPGSPWGSEWLPQRRCHFIDRGVLTTMPTTRYWADKTGVEPVPSPSNLIMQGGQGSLDDLIAGTERGLLITSLWYIRDVDPQSMLYTGLTRDGVFWIENGKIAYPVNNFRWNESPLRVLGNIVEMSESVRMTPRSWSSPTFVVPALKLSGFQLTSVSDAV